MTNNELEFIQLLRSTNPSNHEFIFQALTCAVKFGDTFFNEMQIYLEQKNFGAIREAVAKYTAQLMAEA